MSRKSSVTCSGGPCELWAGDQRTERETDVHRHPLSRRLRGDACWRRQRAEQCGLLGQNDPVATPTMRFKANACQSRESWEQSKATAAPRGHR